MHIRLIPTYPKNQEEQEQDQLGKNETMGVK